MVISDKRSGCDHGGVRSISILGSTGSIGCNTLDLIDYHRELYEVVALTGNHNVELLATQAKRYNAQLVVIGNESSYKALKSALSGTKIEIAAGVEAITAAASRPVDWIMAGIVGAAGLEPALAAVRHCGSVALANKECLVCAGEILMKEVRLNGSTLLPVDSEHNAIFQVFDFDRPDLVRKIILTASGGPFLNFDRQKMSEVTPKQALAHPNWDMGAKISIDSATMMNKGLELIEAYHLFPVCENQIEILIHPQSVVHSMVEYIDGSVLAQLGAADMRTPIAHTLAWPERIHTSGNRLKLSEVGNLSFAEPDITQFPSLKLAREVLRAGGGAPTVLNAANEVAVRAFLEGRVGFTEIVPIIEYALDVCGHTDANSLEAIFILDKEARDAAGNLAGY